MRIYLFNTLTRSIEEFIPIKKNHVGIYTCGPTVYNFAHIGNLRAYIFSDILKRTLLYNNYKVKHVMNVTDVGHLTDDADNGEDKMEKGAKREGKTAWEIAKYYEEAFINDLAELNIITPDIWCRATDHIDEQINLINKLGDKGFTYQTADGVYFDTSKLSDYGKLARLKSQDLRAGVRVDIGDKKNNTDFALWKFSPKLEKRQMEWDSPWGKGFPGWHIECSAMSAKYLDQPFDIHCGGIDHIPVHHTNEIAQSEAAFEKPLANYWLHNEFLLFNKEKMAKSGDNFYTLEQIKKHNISPLSYRYFLLQTHYRKQLNFTFEALQAAQNGLSHLCAVASELTTKESIVLDVSDSETKEEFIKKINDDLDTPGALALVWEAIKNKKISLKQLVDFDRVFGLKIEEKTSSTAGIIPIEIMEIVKLRNEARKQKNWTESDRFRKQIEELGYLIEDNGETTNIKRIL